VVVSSLYKQPKKTVGAPLRAYLYTVVVALSGYE